MASPNRATLGVDGSHAFAHTHANIQEGECEFEPIKDWVDHKHSLNNEEYRQQKLAINRAFQRLKARLGPLSYYIGPSHPDHVG